ncbi:MAG: 2,3-bisphosphoglycerate-dependent phosphoglycerate mutase [Gammaproteobacteria bacterium]|jgi:2,3-bisphosphoglycerate-dependent phosphoglycerate mutase
MKQSYQLVLLRHGQSLWNTQHRLTGWTDVGLTRHGEQQAAAAGKLLAKHGFGFDDAFTSQLKRASDSLTIVLENMGRSDVPVQQHWRLNERHYGALEGLGPLSAVFKFGLRHVVRCQRRFDVVPPLLDLTDPRYPGNQPRFAEIPSSALPRAESMQQAWQRVLPVWDEEMAPAIQAGRRLLIVAHKNILRVLIKQITGVEGSAVERMSIKTGRPLIYELNEALRPQAHYFLDDVQ